MTSLVQEELITTIGGVTETIVTTMIMAEHATVPRANSRNKRNLILEPVSLLLIKGKNSLVLTVKIAPELQAYQVKVKRLNLAPTALGQMRVKAVMQKLQVNPKMLALEIAELQLHAALDAVNKQQRKNNYYEHIC